MTAEDIVKLMQRVERHCQNPANTIDPGRRAWSRAYCVRVIAIGREYMRRNEHTELAPLLVNTALTALNRIDNGVS